MFGNVCRGVPGERDRGRDQGAQGRARRRSWTPTSTSTTCTSLTDGFKELYRERDRRGLPAGPAGAAAPGDPRRVRLVDGRARGRVPPHQPHPRRLGHGGERPADGVRQQGRHARAPASPSAATRSPASREPSGDFLVERPGRGRRVRRAHAARHRTRWRRSMPEAYADAHGDPAHARGATTGTCRTPSSRWRRGSLYMLQTRNAKRPAQAAVRFAVDAVERGAARQARRRSRTIDAATARRAAAPGLRPATPTSTCSPRAWPPRPAPRRARSSSPPTDAVGRGRGGPRRDPRAPVHRGRRRGRLPRRQGDPHRARAARPATRRSWRAGWASRACRAPRRSTSTCTAEDAARERHAAAARAT